MLLRDATEPDLGAILAITNDVIATSTAMYVDDPLTLEDRTAWFAARRRLGYPVLVAEEAGRVLGFSSFGDFRPFPGYRHTVEHSVHVHADARGQGVGPKLVTALFPRAKALDKHMMIAAVDAANAGSIRMHAKLGFTEGGVLREVGRKFDRWLDLVFMQRRLD